MPDLQCPFHDSADVSSHGHGTTLQIQVHDRIYNVHIACMQTAMQAAILGRLLNQAWQDSQPERTPDRFVQIGGTEKLIDLVDRLLDFMALEKDLHPHMIAVQRNMVILLTDLLMGREDIGWARAAFQISEPDYLTLIRRLERALTSAVVEPALASHILDAMRSITPRIVTRSDEG
jgi:hypothetical protein